MSTTSVSSRRSTVTRRTDKIKMLGDLIYADVHAGTGFVHDRLKEIRDHFDELIIGMNYEIKYNATVEKKRTRRRSVFEGTDIR